MDICTFTPILRHIEQKLWTSIKVSHRLGKHLSICFLILLFLLQSAEFNLKAPPYSKRCITRWFPFPALCRHLEAFIIEIGEIPLVWIQPLKNEKFLFFYLISFSLLRPLLLKAQFNLIHLYLNNCFLHHKYANIGF